ncbi:hypothetical protein E2562_022846 [Oryza meyeriana var. granulata]|uniref:Uncharacterized protein n=1 Tax=Oryza meyeriana var. granulata TaxID=110450 RepID=A0A6G1BN36_9ORYZ|nr:hypothetical protein E2562_022846 [Oryza meyeriana var. granulata]
MEQDHHNIPIIPNVPRDVAPPTASLYTSGLYISAAASLWRLVQRDYIVGGNAAAAAGDPSNANLKAALDVLYSLALAQGVLFLYKTIIRVTEPSIAQEMCAEYKFKRRGLDPTSNLVWDDDDHHKSDDELARELVKDYLKETKSGCVKDVSFSKGWNLIQFAVELMESTKPDKYISGELVLQGLRIVGKLAADEDNWRFMSDDTDGLLAMIMAPVSSEGFHDEHHEEWAAIAGGLLQLISRLMAAPAKSHEKMQRQIASSNQVINTIDGCRNKELISSSICVVITPRMLNFSTTLRKQ